MSITIIGIVVIIVFVVIYFIYTSKNSSKSGNKNLTKEGEKKEEIKNSHKVVGKDNKKATEKDVFDFMEFDKISDSMIIQNGGKRYTMVVQCKGINYDLMSTVEQMAVEEGFITFLNTLKYPIQLYVQARAVDLKENLNIYKKSVSEVENKYNEVSEKYRNLLNDIDADYTEINKLKMEVDKQAHILNYAQDITRYVERISLNKSILQRKFYIVLSYNKDEVATTTDFTEQEIYDICYRELYTRAQSLISALMGCSVAGRVLNSNELAELLYISYNRDDEKLLDVKTALESGFYRLYSTSKDVFEKKEEAMQKEVEKEAKRRVQDAIEDILQTQEKKTPDELIEEYEERVDKEALNIIETSDTPREAKNMLKNKIIESHVIGVESRKIDRRLRKENNLANSNNTENVNTVKTVKIEENNASNIDTVNINNQDQNAQVNKNNNNLDFSSSANINFEKEKEEIPAVPVEKANEVKEDVAKEKHENIITEEKVEEKNDPIINNNIVNEAKKEENNKSNIHNDIEFDFDDRLSSDETDDDAGINI